MRVNSIAFIYDHRYYVTDSGQVFSSGPMGSEAWERYLELVEELVVVGTLIDKPKELSVDNLNRSDLPKTKFSSFEYISNFKSFLKNLFFINKGLEKELLKTEAVAARLPGELPYNAIRIAKKNKIPYWIEVVGCPWDAYWNHGSIIGKIIAPFAYIRQKIAVRSADYVTYVTENFLQNRYPTKGKSIHATNAIIPPIEDQILETKQSILSSLSKKNSIHKIGMIGSFNVRYKGHEEIIKALSLVKNKIPPFEIRMVGPGDAQWVRDMAFKYDIADHVKIVGKLKSGSEIQHFLDDLHLYVHPSRQEGLPRSVIEAMSRACPVLGATTGGIPELLSEKSLHPTGNYHKLAVQINEVLNDNNSLKEESMRNFHKAQDYLYSKLNNRRKEFFKSILNQIDKK